jgi:hypothetical protein
MGSQRPLLPCSSRTVAISSASASVERVLCTDVVISSTCSLKESAFLRLGLSEGGAQEADRWVKIIEVDVSPHRIETPATSATYMTYRQVFTRVVASVDMSDLRPHPDFVSAVQEVTTYASQEEQARGLRKILRSWGSVIPTIIELGCAIVSTTSFQNSDVCPV